MKFYHISESTAYYFDDDWNKHEVYLREGYISLEEFQWYCEEYKKVDYSVIAVDRFEDNTLYFYSDIV